MWALLVACLHLLFPSIWKHHASSVSCRYIFGENDKKGTEGNEKVQLCLRICVHVC